MALLVYVEEADTLLWQHLLSFIANHSEQQQGQWGSGGASFEMLGHGGFLPKGSSGEELRHAAMYWAGQLAIAAVAVVMGWTYLSINTQAPEVR
jgi:hypothetical protein